MKDIVMSVITALGVNVILIGMEIVLNMEFSMMARMIIVVPAVMLIRMCAE